MYEPALCRVSRAGYHIAGVMHHKLDLMPSESNDILRLGGSFEGSGTGTSRERERAGRPEGKARVRFSERDGYLGIWANHEIAR